MPNKSQDGSAVEMITGHKIAVLISAEPGLLRDSIYTILQSISNLTVVGVVAGERESLDALDQFHPEVVLVECSPNAQWWLGLCAICASTMHIKCIAITDTIKTSQLAHENGADGALIKGFSSQDLQQTLRWVVNNSRAMEIPREKKKEMGRLVPGGADSQL